MRGLVVVCFLLGAAAAPAASRNAHPPRTGTLVVTAPAGAFVEVDMLEVGTTPLVPTELPVGKHQVRVWKPGHADHAETVTIVAGKTTEVLAELLPIAGVLSVKGDEKGARVFVDGKEVGAVPLEGHELAPGTREVLVRFSRGKVIQRKLTAVPGQEYAIVANLGEAVDPGTLAAPSVPVAVASPAPVAASSPAVPPATEVPAGPEKLGTGAKDGPPKVAAAPAPAPPPNAAPAEAVAGAVPPPPMEQDPWYGRWWVWAAVGAGVAAGVLVPLTMGGEGEPEYVRLPPDPARDCPGGGCVVLGGVR